VVDSPFLVIVTDLDGTLLDHDTYGCEAARDTLDRLTRNAVPVVLCSSKTQAEIAAVQRELGIRHPCISENGGALFIPDDYFPFLPSVVRRVHNGVAVEFGSPYRDVVAALQVVASRLRTTVVGFNDMSVEEVAQVCRLSLAQARLAKLREYDEPFRITSPGPAARARLRAALQARGFRYTRGGRFDHVTGATDKGLPLAALATLYQRNVGRRALTIGLGDGLNDLSLLANVDIPIVVRNRAAATTGRLLARLPAARVTQKPGPAGWSEAVCEVLAAVAPLARQADQS
jgi:mannosyl-3-phosphoglycerate phosphatase